ncbi:uncharacterized protein [Apostichopus japonicus]|uniref:uncharacterized protein n=1 Tax=Stichopus japonicus TaxID=307972 RepID=UPI003AB88981
MMLWTTQTLLQWSLLITTLLSQPMRRSGIVQAKGRTRSCETTGIGMGGSSSSCDCRCFDRYNEDRTCQCNYQCIKFDNCCRDYEDCNEQASCATRCGARYNSPDVCHCDNLCEEKGNCCFDYPEHCNPPTSSTEVPTLTTEANGEPPTSTTAVTNLTPKAYGGTDSGLIVVVILVICLVITSAIAAAVFILVRKRRTNPTTTENGSNANGSGPTNVTSGTGPEEQGSVYYSSVKESEYANQEEGFDSNFAYQIYEKQIFQDIVTT